eukprot:TRINITY_DN48138_c0_g1_i1.p1 TRINITY_DN48138_c0_g1~~TRINITY_DN48138_c0_g1_i1.p1  ORF type:complete len:619 (-),score=105.07 TRINITY_DN48138_c0_g1_i1:7-1809(-)
MACFSRNFLDCLCTPIGAAHSGTLPGQDKPQAASTPRGSGKGLFASTMNAQPARTLLESKAKYDKYVEDHKKRTEVICVEQGGLMFVVHPTIFMPNISHHFMKLGDSIYPKGGTMLDVGSGCGVIAVHAAVSGVNHVLATDIVPASPACILENAQQHGVAAKVEGRISDVFSGIRSDEKFDVIFWNYPFISDMSSREYDELSDVERGIRDPGQGHLKTYCEEASQFLNPGGRLFVSYSKTMGDWDRFLEIMQETGWSADMFADFSEDGPQVQLYELRRLETKTPAPKEESQFKSVLAVILAFAAGMCIPSQSGVNASLRRDMNSPFATACVSFTVGFLVITTLAVLQHPAIPKKVDILSALSEVPWYAYLGSCLGPVYVTTAILLVERLGFAALQLSVICGQLTTALLIDATGFLGVPKRKPTILRCISLLVLTAGVALTLSFNDTTLEWWNIVLLCVIALCSGSAFPLQAILNAVLAKHLRSPLRATSVSFFGGSLLMAISAGAFHFVGYTVDLSFKTVQPWMFLGGMCGSVSVFAHVFGIPKLGAAAFTCVFIAAQVVTAMTYDAAGAFSMEPRPTELRRVAGAVLAVGAAVLYQLKK